MTYGDRNTTFFHASCTERRRKNRIGSLKTESGGWVENEVEKRSFITNHFSQFFRSSGNQNTQRLLDCVDNKVTSEMNSGLLQEFPREEVYAALKSIGNLKAPGPDGMPAIFYKEYWDIVCDDVVTEVPKVLGGRSPMPARWSDTTIILIPKVKKPEHIKDLRPISLCNVIYKLVSKVLANRLKRILSEVVSQSQSAFVSGCLITDNILIAYESTHFLKQKKKGKLGFAAIKLYMNKAYDRVEWRFLRKMMLRLGFHRRWVELVMMCVTSVKYRIRVNGELTEVFVPKRGLRQGDPLSPYLFLLCAEGFSSLLAKAEAEGRICGVRVCRGAPPVSHLLFADDSLILCRATEEEAANLKDLLRVYEECSGQVINADKSAVLFSPNTGEFQRRRVQEILNIRAETKKNKKYLGLPVSVGKSKTNVFAYLKERIWQRIQGWKEKLLSKASKEIMIKAVVQAIPAFAMGCFDITKEMCNPISSLVAKYRWNNRDKENSMHWVSWEKLMASKEDGGLGFRDLHSFNMAILAKQGWRLIQDPESLCAKILKAKYFPNAHILEAVAKNGCSYTWRSIVQGIEVLKEGVIWRVGNGQNVDIWSDPWLPRGSHVGL